jgi:predicted MPP superfamily phosphohydrolase
MARLAEGAWLQFKVARLEWNRATLPVPGLPAPLQGLRIIHLTDAHFRKQWQPGHTALLERIAENPPDLILFTGDFVEDKKDPRPALPLVRRFVEGLRSRLGTYAILGNHDGPHLDAPIRAMNLHLLDAERRLIEHQGATIELIALPGPYRDSFSPHFAPSLPPRAPGMLRIILSHYPDHLPRVQTLQPDLFLAGHTHGGQCCLPWRIPLLRHDSLPRRLCAGVHRAFDTWLVVGRGLGFSGLPLRVFCPSEVIELVLTRP